MSGLKAGICVIAALLVLAVGCKTSQPTQSRSELTERDFEALLARTAAKMDRFAADEEIRFSPEEKTALMCLIPAEVFSIFGPDLLNIQSSRSYFSNCLVPVGNELKVYAAIDTQDMDKALISRIFDASFDTTVAIAEYFDTCHVVVDSTNIIYKSLPAKQKNALLAAHLIRLSGITDFNKRLLSIWRDKSIDSRVREVCMSVAFANCDEATYRVVRDELLGRRLSPAQKAALLSHTVGCGSHYLILLHIFAYQYAEDICRGEGQEAIDYLRCKVSDYLNDFNGGINNVGAKVMLCYWICDRDYLILFPGSYNMWTTDLKSKYAQAGIVCNAGDIHVKPLVASELLDAFDAKTLFDRMGLTREQFGEIPIRQLLVWDKLTKEKRKRLINKADKKLNEEAQRKLSGDNKPIDAEDAREILRSISLDQYKVLRLFEEFHNGEITQKQLAGKIIRVQKHAVPKAKLLKFLAAEKEDSVIAEAIADRIVDVLYAVENNDLESAEKIVTQLRLFFQNALSPDKTR